MYKYRDIIDDVDVITIRSIDSVSVYNAFRKVFTAALAEGDEFFNELTWNNFTRNDRFSPVVNKYIFDLFKFLSNKKYIGNNTKRSASFEKILNLLKEDNSSYEENKNASAIVEEAKNIFKLAKLDGSASDVVILADEFDIFKNEEDRKKFEKIYFNFDAFDGCDIPS
ncbi:hypothetical protein MCANPG14_00683 [Mycoplasmopsis canis PG 14]|uniref:Uncharacterized protein n=1 Tax=Mycoplasmopsis canis TaxID=29555 RepID=A0A449AQ64_9BACT|nr:hypothetical protein [Mycoplasmopsis canis]AMD81410.1 hypothetical protein AXW82_02525 [Mycoplasmopsis canis PG 14]EIE40891.1 hypothetical protein MCANPG14_00683 [Mycoplasmopsis canis PG 14]VEU68607.1 Uncharacterised protein [Mycoplasmopsis canis]